MQSVAGFPEKVFNHLKPIQEAAKGIRQYTLGWDSQGYLAGIAHDLETLEKLLKKKVVEGVVSDYTVMGNLAFSYLDFNMHNNTQLVNIGVQPEVELQNYLKSQTINNDLLGVLERQMIANNQFTAGLHNYITSSNAIHIESKVHVLGGFDSNGRLPLYRYLTVFSDGVTLFISGHQIAFLTSAGMIKVSDMVKPLGVEKLIPFLSNITRIDNSHLRMLGAENLSV